MLKEIYERYGSAETFGGSYKAHYGDNEGYLNSTAFTDFSAQITPDDGYYLVCLSIDLRNANCIERGYGDYVLMKFYNRIKGIDRCYIFRIQGEKFNVFVHEESLEKLKNFLKKPNDDYKVYAGYSDRHYNQFSSGEILQDCIEKMYREKKEYKMLRKGMTAMTKNDMPVGLRETDTLKYRKTMWYSIGKIIMPDSGEEETVYIFPTEKRSDMQSLPLLVVVDNLRDYRYYTGTDIQFGYPGVLFHINARFNHDGKLNVSMYTDGEKKDKYTCYLNTADGCGIPASFGMRIGLAEIYPIKMNVHGVCDYVYYDNSGDGDTPEVQIVRSGLVTMNGKPYEVYMDENYIQLIEHQQSEM